MNSPGLHYSSLCLCNRAHFTHRILLYLHAFIQRASLIPCNITAHLSVCIILLWLVRLWSCCSNGCQIPLLSRIYGCGNTMALEWVQEDSEPANLYSGTEVIQTTKRKKIWHAQRGSSFANCIESPIRDGRVICSILWQVFKFWHLIRKVFVISEGKSKNE